MNIILLQIIRLRRIIQEIPIIYLIFISAFIFFIFYFIYTKMDSDIEGYAIVVTYITIIGFYHRRRSDNNFIKLLYQKRFLIYLFEYTIFLSPLLILILLSLNFKLLILCLLVIIIPFIPCKNEISLNKAIKLFWGKWNSFEWFSGIRKSYISIIIYYIISLVLNIYSNLSILCFLLILSHCLYFYRDGEPIEFLCVPELSTRKFLYIKIWNSIYYFHILSIPFYVVYLIYHIEYWYYLIILSLSSVISFSFFILYKYANFQMNKQNIGSDVILSIVFLLSLIPLFIPIFLFVFIFLYKKSFNKLNPYQNDFY